jgi:hypothetical protein
VEGFTRESGNFFIVETSTPPQNNSTQSTTSPFYKSSLRFKFRDMFIKILLHHLPECLLFSREFPEQSSFCDLSLDCSEYRDGEYRNTGTLLKY